MKYVIGVDLGTSAVKALLVDQSGQVVHEASANYPLYHEQSGYSEQRPEDWMHGTIAVMKQLLDLDQVSAEDVEGISFSGQMHGLVLLDANHRVLRNAILWNDTRTTTECRWIEERLGPLLLGTARNAALEGFTLPKLLWVKAHEPDLYKKADVFLLPKDYVRYRMTGHIAQEYSDAAGTLLLDVANKRWSSAICSAVGIEERICPPLVESHACVGTVTADFAAATGLSVHTKVYAGGADNACGAIGAGILSEGKAMCSIGTSGVILAYEANQSLDVAGKVHFFNHAQQDAYYAMGVTLAAGYSLQWYHDTFCKTQSFPEMLQGMASVDVGAKGLLFTPYLVGERTPHPDANIRGSFIGMDASHTVEHFTRAVVEGITFSLRESLDILRDAGKKIGSMISIGGGAKNEAWLQMQADVFNCEIVRLTSEQGPGMGAAMLAAYGSGWFDSLEACADAFLRPALRYLPVPDHVAKYDQLYRLYQQIYQQTSGLSESLAAFR
ncbi:xylulokinase [Paenibacillus guangzhouensis]|uniref:xylulokinase n=1 Tax=Paenibacillus guangzhouensis TaxID=1473112 RepID=UPI001266FC1D|nr:xylulokinase [Paenibacillus guangzhouensis]